MKIKEVPNYIWLAIVLFIAIPFAIIGAVLATISATALRGFVFGFKYVDQELLVLTRGASSILSRKKR